MTAFLPDTGTLPGWDGWVPQSILFRGRVIYCVMLMAVDGILPMIMTSYRQTWAIQSIRQIDYLSTTWVVASAGVTRCPPTGFHHSSKRRNADSLFQCSNSGRHYYSCLLSSLLYCHHRGHPFLMERNMQNSPGALSLSSEGENLQEHRKGVDRPYPCCWRCLRMGPVR